jgi:hypothetical protein
LIGEKSVIVPIPYVHTGIGLLTALLAIPLIMRKVPMNRAYGIRVRKAFLSDSNWYELNAYGGKLFLVFGIFLAAFGWVGKDLAPPPTSPWAPVFTIAPMLTIIPILLLVKSFAGRLPER